MSFYLRNDFHALLCDAMKVAWTMNRCGRESKFWLFFFSEKCFRRKECMQWPTFDPGKFPWAHRPPSRDEIPFCDWGIHQSHASQFIIFHVDLKSEPLSAFHFIPFHCKIFHYIGSFLYLINLGWASGVCVLFHKLLFIYSTMQAVHSSRSRKKNNDSKPTTTTTHFTAFEMNFFFVPSDQVQPNEWKQIWNFDGS